MNDRRPISVPLLVLLLIAAAAAFYGTWLHMDRLESAMNRADRLEQELGATTRLVENLATLRATISKRSDRNEKMLISFIEDMATRNRISLASITIDPGTLSDASRINRFYKEVDTTIRIKQIPLKNIVLFMADVQSEDPDLKPTRVSLMPCEGNSTDWDARVVISYFVFDEDTTQAGGATEKTP